MQGHGVSLVDAGVAGALGTLNRLPVNHARGDSVHVAEDGQTAVVSSDALVGAEVEVGLNSEGVCVVFELGDQVQEVGAAGANDGAERTGRPDAVKSDVDVVGVRRGRGRFLDLKIGVVKRDGPYTESASNDGPDVCAGFDDAAIDRDGVAVAQRFAVDIELLGIRAQHATVEIRRRGAAASGARIIEELHRLDGLPVEHLGKAVTEWRGATVHGLDDVDAELDGAEPYLRLDLLPDCVVRQNLESVPRHAVPEIVCERAAEKAEAVDQ